MADSLLVVPVEAGTYDVWHGIATWGLGNMTDYTDEEHRRRQYERLLELNQMWEQIPEEERFFDYGDWLLDNGVTVSIPEQESNIEE